ncbi:hypothetical protein [Jiulongibacter sp. NS-SX5]|uniref:hypothetical protein n=1 Tax=Jiulongibacter sp. NS-SX5 TaxID=3463854 RepID=UPI00405A411D
MNFKLIVGLAATLFLSTSGFGQSIHQLKKVDKPLVLASQGSFYVGGESSDQSFTELGSFGPAGHITINQMYVRYMVPQNVTGSPVIMIHGMTLTGKTWETTPDGRIGWDEYFVRNGFPVYIPDQVGRGRSGFNQAAFNRVRGNESKPQEQAPMWRFSDETVIPNFRIGDTTGIVHSESLFPEEALVELSKQAVPDVSMSLPNPNPTFKALADLSTDLNKATLISHSQSGSYPIEAALIDPEGIKNMILVEPGHCPTELKEEQLIKLKNIPTVVVFGDYLDQPTGVPHSWRTAYESCKIFTEELTQAGGKAEIWHLPEMGYKGNSHVLMQDKNNLQIADLLMNWLNKN